MAILLPFWFCAVYGISNAIAVLKFGQYYIHPLADHIPVVRNMVHCVACTSMWIGVLASWIVFSPIQLAWHALQLACPELSLAALPMWKTLFMDGAAASAVSYLLYSFTEWLDPTVNDAPAENSSHLPDSM